ncbi:conserved hypothetical protein [Bathymodiolus platifrons methanotrophic gill symbiont]|uniref:hypothetical protein n=1 Tax=Bathymodiolus platifrons methanotrophic gill symbiont TaxID=113268 RepID=UPI000B408AE3|nr:hypothetical protein [Bathymodiolus platifrons methanotrophic gill symbiont]GAW87319.1 conserved hypothetical protein [Bathymodiolus platifrons methanotrophic gill symbiont]GFO74264.1 hypothetical protein BPLS_P0828 [Bathymodiolus platifrons methanotrophic gill symbiont]GFO76752.1 hypothetical protein BPLS_P4726 [Bathymodiolus platifrons methanotrophic gill symbiont]
MSAITLKKCTLPETNTKYYLTAITALNIYSEDGTGDWHFSENFLENESFIPRKTVAGVDTCSTNEYLGDKGVFNCYQTLLESGVQPSTKNVFSADHYRAIADMVFDSITKGHEIEGSIILDDWLPEQHEKEKLYLLINSFKSAVTEKQWQKIEVWKMKS